MHVSQYAYFALFGRSTPAAAMAAVLGLEPDETTVRGSRIPEPKAVPVRHAWKVVCREPGLCVDEQIAHIVHRLAPHTQAIATLANRLVTEGEGCGAVLEVVRYFNGEGGGDAFTAAPDLFGWHLDREVLDFLHATGAVLDVDEYDMIPAPVTD
ncbi:DUF4279 domain-containing protein [Dactylosporangium aurantiacum]|uniref:DUF4279 domain-containing protein n=1 Tax=Dactylosporangium aurantiacum TaxID=35754 RepID=A0A9Q9MLT2_9ACTN|nr:DUF4279 domain-containing protein [Dactylosporangium aurantiacum]MDG6109949.1 DUF4279 domain-containing protein [Dactylosporangium aurantiacum]UWZ57296.1 DUF4279 domain-containing protein [Dactylosporangium aurantiacum]